MGYNILSKYKSIDSFLTILYSDFSELSLIKFANLLYRIINPKVREKEISITEESKEELIGIIKNKFEELSFTEILDETHPPHIINHFETFNANLSKLKDEVNSYIFNGHGEFFKVIKIFKETTIVNGSSKEYSISKKTLSKLIDIEKVEKYISSIYNTPRKQESFL